MCPALRGHRGDEKGEAAEQLEWDTERSGERAWGWRGWGEMEEVEVMEMEMVEVEIIWRWWRWR